MQDGEKRGSNVKKAILDRPPASPSNPSVKLTALLVPTNINNIKNPYKNPKLIWIFKVL